MINNTLQTYAKNIASSIVIGIICGFVIVFVYSKYSFLIDFDPVISKGISVFSAIIISLMFKRLIDADDKIKELELPANTPSRIKEYFDDQRASYTLNTTKNKVTIAYIFTLVLFFLISLTLSASITEVNIYYGMFFNSALTITCLVFSVYAVLFINRQTDISRNAKSFLSEIIKTEQERQKLIDAINKNIRDGVSKVNTTEIRKNKEFNIREYVDNLEKEVPPPSQDKQ